MTQYRNALPQLGSAIFATDGGLETTLIYGLNVKMDSGSHPLSRVRSDEH